MATFGQRLKELRVEHNLTQDELVIAFIAKFPDVPLDKSKISRYERGITKPSHFDVVECLSYFFGVTPGYLMGRSKHRRATPYRRIPILKKYNPAVPLQVQEDVARHEYVEEGDADSYSKEIAMADNLKGSLDGELGAGRKMAGEVAFTVDEDESAWEFVFEPQVFGFGQAIYDISASDIK